MRSCRSCQVTQSLSNFRKGRLACKACEAVQTNKTRRQRKASIMEKVVAYLMDHPCVDCGETDWQVLEFDHRDPSKKHGGVADMIHERSWVAVRAEIEKCDVRCANCHRRKTALDNGWYTYFSEGRARMQ